MYAIIDLKGHQYIVKKGDTIVVDKLDNEVNSELTLDSVLAVFDEEGTNVSVGTPYLSTSKVVVKVIETKKGEKTDVIKFRRKTRYQRKYGFRPLQTILHVEEVKA